MALVSASDVHVLDLTAAAPACCIVSSSVLVAAAVSKLTESGPQSVISRNERTNFNLLFRLLIVAFWLRRITFDAKMAGAYDRLYGAQSDSGFKIPASVI